MTSCSPHCRDPDPGGQPKTVRGEDVPVSAGAGGRLRFPCLSSGLEEGACLGGVELEGGRKVFLELLRLIGCG